MNAFPRSNKGATIQDFANIDITSITGDTFPSQQKALGYVKSSFWFFGLIGTTGTGKTRFGLCLLALLAQAGQTKTGINNIVAPEDIGYYKAHNINKLCMPERDNIYQPKTRIFESCKVLMIDELKKAEKMPFKDSSIIENILEVRHDKGLRTILTSNILKNEFQQEYPAIFSRCRRGLFELNGTDRRR